MFLLYLGSTARTLIIVPTPHNTANLKIFADVCLHSHNFPLSIVILNVLPSIIHMKVCVVDKYIGIFYTCSKTYCIRAGVVLLCMLI